MNKNCLKQDIKRLSTMPAHIKSTHILSKAKRAFMCGSPYFTLTYQIDNDIKEDLYRNGLICEDFEFNSLIFTKISIAP